MERKTRPKGPLTEGPTIGVRLSDDVAERLRQEAAADQVSMGAIVRRALRLYFALGDMEPALKVIAGLPPHAIEAYARGLRPLPTPKAASV